jgi:hypothetical protein
MARGQNKRPQTKTKKRPTSSRSALRHAVRIVHHVCCVAGAHSLIEDTRSEGAPKALGSAIEQLDTPALYDWLITALSYQGISNGAASAYLEKHGSVTWAEIEHHLSKLPPCPKLRSYWHFHQCGYFKSRGTCSQPEHFASCPLPKHPLRNGRLNQSAYALYLFIRDIADSDLVGWIDAQIRGAPDNATAMRESLLRPLRHVFGVADKVLSMSLSMILLSAQDERTHWHLTGGSMIAVDTLVHKWLHRTGILTRCRAEHPYGQACYENDGCAGIIEKIAARIDAREFNRAFPSYFPRYVQYAIWRFCAQDELDICNSNRIDDRKRCQDKWCRLFKNCDRRSVYLFMRLVPNVIESSR